MGGNTAGPLIKHVAVLLGKRVKTADARTKINAQALGRYLVFNAAVGNSLRGGAQRIQCEQIGFSNFCFIHIEQRIKLFYLRRKLCFKF